MFVCDVKRFAKMSLNGIGFEIISVDLMQLSLFKVPCQYIRNSNFVITVTADGLTPNSARPSAGTLLIKNLAVSA